MTSLIEIRILIGLLAILLISVSVALLRDKPGCVSVLCASIILSCTVYLVFWIGMSFYPPERNEWIMKNKPTCTDDTIECMEDKLQWYKDSAEYDITSTVFDPNKVKDSLRTELKKYEGKRK